MPTNTDLTLLTHNIKGAEELEIEENVGRPLRFRDTIYHFEEDFVSNERLYLYIVSLFMNLLPNGEEEITKVENDEDEEKGGNENDQLN